jgi:hypothetical protein
MQTAKDYIIHVPKLKLGSMKVHVSCYVQQSVIKILLFCVAFLFFLAASIISNGVCYISIGYRNAN